MENFSRSVSKNLSRSVSSFSDANKVWRRTADEGFDGRRSIRTVHLGEDNRGRFWKIKKMFNFTNSKKDTKSTRSSKIAGSEDEFQNRLLFEIYKNMSSTRELGSF
ncbi:hypothetical protein OSB04_000352 [Centaurea solstitialis]|uniref:Uncharacterized protein n=1 Tax=Centaurea solstitialis TaxID=347529 RepID=A0AA38TZF9_9ASTR|nr:hypothetical protein OSB04_000352 [Centaurea solstitialis]